MDDILRAQREREFLKAFGFKVHPFAEGVHKYETDTWLKSDFEGNSQTLFMRPLPMFYNEISDAVDDLLKEKYKHVRVPVLPGTGATTLLHWLERFYCKEVVPIVIETRIVERNIPRSSLFAKYRNPLSWLGDMLDDWCQEHGIFIERHKRPKVRLAHLGKVIKAKTLSGGVVLIDAPFYSDSVALYERYVSMLAQEVDSICDLSLLTITRNIEAVEETAKVKKLKFMPFWNPELLEQLIDNRLKRSSRDTVGCLKDIWEKCPYTGTPGPSSPRVDESKHIRDYGKREEFYLVQKVLKSIAIEFETAIQDHSEFRSESNPGVFQGIPEDLYAKLRECLVRLDQFDNHQNLRTVFTVNSLWPWRDKLPERDTREKRVEAVIELLAGEYNDTLKENALAIFLRRLKGLLDPLDGKFNILAELTTEIELLLEYQNGNIKDTKTL